METTRRPGIHFASLATSKRLQRVLTALQAAGAHGLTTREIVALADVCAVNSAICELRRNGFPTECRMEGRTDSGASVFRYILK